MDFLIYFLYNYYQMIFIPLICAIISIFLYKKIRKKRIPIQIWHLDGTITESKKKLVGDKIQFTDKWQATFKTNEVRTFIKKKLGGLITRKINGLIFIEGARKPVAFRSKKLDLGIPLTEKEISNITKRQIAKQSGKFKPFTNMQFFVVMITLMFIAGIVFLQAMKFGVFK